VYIVTVLQLDCSRTSLEQALLDMVLDINHKVTILKMFPSLPDLLPLPVFSHRTDALRSRDLANSCLFRSTVSLAPLAFLVPLVSAYRIFYLYRVPIDPVAMRSVQRVWYFQAATGEFDSLIGALSFGIEGLNSLKGGECVPFGNVVFSI
jgi:hypothetical protein